MWNRRFTLLLVRMEDKKVASCSYMFFFLFVMEHLLFFGKENKLPWYYYKKVRNYRVLTYFPSKNVSKTLIDGNCITFYSGYLWRFSQIKVFIDNRYLYFTKLGVKNKTKNLNSLLPSSSATIEQLFWIYHHVEIIWLSIEFWRERMKN